MHPAGFPVLHLDCPVHGDEARALAIEAVDAGRIVMEQPHGLCQLCGNVAETRPYGPNSEEVCFDCGMKDPAAAARGFERRFA
jgi:hypothetical protein